MAASEAFAQWSRPGMGDWQAALRPHVGAGSAQVYRAVAEGQLEGDELLARTPSGTLGQQPGAEQPAEALPEAATAALPPQLERAASSVGPPPVAAPPPRRATAAQPPATASHGRGRQPRSAAQAAAGAWQELREELRQPASATGRSTRSAAAAMRPGPSTQAAAAAVAPQRTPPQLPPRTKPGLSPGGQMTRKRSLQDLLQGAEVPAAGAAPEGQQAPAAPSLPPLPPLAGSPALPAAAGWPRPPRLPLAAGLPPLAPAAGLPTQRPAAGQALQLHAASRPPLPLSARPQLAVTPPVPADSNTAAAAAAAAEGPKPACSASAGEQPESSGERLGAAPAEPALLYHERRLQYQAQRRLAPQVWRRTGGAGLQRDRAGRGHQS